MRASRLISALAWAVSLVVFIGYAVQGVQGYYTGACVKMPAAGGKGTQFYMRVPQGKKYNKARESFPGQTIFQGLAKCHIFNYTCSYDVDGNAHVDFVQKDRVMKVFPNNCDASLKIETVTKGAYKPNCQRGTPETLATLWRVSWK